MRPMLSMAGARTDVGAPVAPDENIRLDDYFQHIAFLVDF